MSLKSKAFNILKFTVIGIVALNFILLLSDIFNEGFGKYPMARTNMVIARFINKSYVIPSQMALGAGVPIALPFVKIRQFFYKSGKASFPVNEGEKYFWWASINEPEYFQIYRPFIYNKITGKHSFVIKKKNDKSIDITIGNELNRGLNRFFTYFLATQNKPFSDPIKESQNILLFYRLSNTYIIDKALISKFFFNEQNKKIEPVLFDLEEIKKFYFLYEQSKRLTTLFKEHQPKHFNLYKKSEVWYMDKFVQNQSLAYFLASKRFAENMDICSMSSELDDFENSRKIINKALTDSKTSPQMKDSLTEFNRQKFYKDLILSVKKCETNKR